ncbi:MAG: hypothetical protein QOH32_3187 [Bradyrhizobium sp.]|jgi:hypothetical protein|nr:hypothetical protein [Bradyrhizobium sp.]
MIQRAPVPDAERCFGNASANPNLGRQSLNIKGLRMDALFRVRQFLKC